MKPLKNNMKQIFRLFSVMVMVAGIMLVSCKKDENSEKPDNKKQESPATLSFEVYSVPFTMVKVTGGTFQMGGTAEQGDDVTKYELPIHSVTLSDYYIGETEVTQALWRAVMGDNPSYFKKDSVNKEDVFPVEHVTYLQCDTFLRKLSVLTGKTFRLPTEAEWEYAARGGNKSNGYKYSGSNSIDSVAWYKENSGNSTHPVKQKNPNELGLYDMSGNVQEWCSDWRADYKDTAQVNPTGPEKGSYRIMRGGNWLYDATYCRVSKRYEDGQTHKYFINGLRLVMVP